MSSRSKTCSDSPGRRPISAGVAALAVSLLTCCGPHDVPPDAAAPRDAGADGGRDGGLDSGAVRDGGRDAGRDADAGAPPPVWVPLEGLPEGCELSLAADPAAVAGPLRFEPCPDMAGCRQLVVDWTSETPPPLNIVTGTHDGDHGYFVYARGAEPGWRWIVVAREDEVLAVLRSREPGGPTRFQCYAYNVSVSALRGAVSIVTSVPDAIGDTAIGLIEWGSGAPTFRVLATLSAAELGLNNYVQELEIGDDFVAGQVVPRYDVVRVGFDGSVRIVTGAEPGSPTLQAGGHEGLFYMTIRPDSGLWTATAGDDAGRVLWAPADADIGGIETDGVDLVWAQMYEMQVEYDYDRVELWTAPFTTDPAAMAPRRVAEVPVRWLANNLRAGGRHAVVGEHTELLSVYALDGGRIGVLRPPPGTEWRGNFAAFLGPEELAVMPSRLRTFPPESSTLRIIRYDALPTE